jgi:hypothetical protein
VAASRLLRALGLKDGTSGQWAFFGVHEAESAGTTFFTRAKVLTLDMSADPFAGDSRRFHAATLNFRFEC